MFGKDKRERPFVGHVSFEHCTTGDGFASYDEEVAPGMRIWYVFLRNDHLFRKSRNNERQGGRFKHNCSFSLPICGIGKSARSQAIDD